MFIAFSSIDSFCRKGKWDIEEDALLLEGYKKYGKSWVKISAMVTGRTQRQCRTRWCKLLKRLPATETLEITPANPMAVDGDSAVAPAAEPTDQEPIKSPEESFYDDSDAYDQDQDSENDLY